MREDIDESGLEPGVPVWAVFGDLMSGLLGAFVLILVWCSSGARKPSAARRSSRRSRARSRPAA